MTDTVQSRPHTLFVYGSLLQTLGLHHNLAGAHLLGPALTAGRLYDLGAFPGLTPGDDPVVGELYAIDDATLESLDHIEGFSPSSPETSFYRRERLPVTRLGDGAVREAWTYFYNQSVRGRPRVPHGDWRRLVLERTAGPHPVLCYGSNLSSARLHARVGATPPVRTGVLPGYRLVFNKRPSLGEAAYANLAFTEAAPEAPTGDGVLVGDPAPVPAAPFTVVLLTPNQLDVLDDYEGVPDHYLRTTLPAAWDGQPTPRPSFVYLAHPAMIIPDVAPAEPYAALVRAGYAEHGFVPAF